MLQKDQCFLHHSGKPVFQGNHFPSQSNISSQRNLMKSFCKKVKTFYEVIFVKHTSFLKFQCIFKDVCACAVVFTLLCQSFISTVPRLILGLTSEVELELRYLEFYIKDHNNFL